jgi:hypothetical protein
MKTTYVNIFPEILYIMNSFKDETETNAKNVTTIYTPDLY